MSIIVKLSGGTVLSVENDTGENVEVRQYHRDFYTDGEDTGTDYDGTYEVVYKA